MPNIRYAGEAYPVAPGETVLDCLLRHGIALSYSCKAGACQSCLVKGASDAPLPEAAQRGLKDTLRAQGYFLACCARPEADLNVSLAGAHLRTAARISHLESLNDTVLRVRLRTDAPLDYFSGQFVTLFREDGLARSYSLASLPHENHLELHVRKIPGGAMSEWLHHRAGPETTVSLQGPSGNCFYVPGKPEEPLLLAGAGTGLAPLYGILRDALRQSHEGPVWLFHGALTAAGLYLVDELAALEEAHPNFHYVRCVLAEGSTMDQAILAAFPSLAGWKGYLCGDPALVNLLRKKLFLAGMASKSIYADAFLPSAPA